IPPATSEETPLLNYVPPVPMHTPVVIASQAPAAPTAELEIKSPMIGTFYRAPSPEAAPYIEVGAEVNPDTVVCIIEAMKVMNEIKAEAKGVVTEALVENAKPVEFGQPLVKLRPTCENHRWTQMNTDGIGKRGFLADGCDSPVRGRVD